MIDVNARTGRMAPFARVTITMLEVDDGKQLRERREHGVKQGGSVLQRLVI